MQFKELLNIEAQVKRVNKYWPQEISVWFITHPDDYTLEIERIFFESKSNGKTYRLVLLEEVEDEPIEVSEENLPTVSEKHERDAMAVKRQSLALAIKKHCQLLNISEESVLEELYRKYKITSRSQLTAEQLNEEIHFFTFQ